MKGLIIAAGRGSRLENLTKHTPKSLTNIGNSCFLENTIQHFRSLGVTEVGVVVGYKKEQFKKIKNVTFFENNNWENNNILLSLFHARSFMDDDLIIAYGDIWFEVKSVQSIYESTGNFVIAVDQDWKKYYQGRTDHPISEAENVNYDHNLHAIEIGKHISSPEDNSQNMGEFMGLLKISKNVIRDIVNEFEDVEKNIKNTDAFQNAKKFQNAYLTDFIQYLIDKDYDINCCINKQGWYEVDTLQDLDNLKSTLGVSNDRK